MDAVDASEHYEITTGEETPSLLTIIIDTNPRAWSVLADTLPLSRAVANILVLVNSHLAFSSANQVAIIASHTRRAVWLYPTPLKPAQEDVGMRDAESSLPGKHAAGRTSANKFPQFFEIEATLLTSLRSLINTTSERDLTSTTTLISRALTIALAYINKAAISLPTTKTKPAAGEAKKTPGRSADDSALGLHARILVVSVSDSSAAQYIETMNAVFAASHSGIAIDVLSLHGSATFLQQAAYITRGTFLHAAKHPQGLLAYLMLGFGSSGSRDDASAVVSASADTVDFRAACFCHRRVVDTGYVCSICLSIFCDVPPDAECLTCGTRLALGNYGATPHVTFVPGEKRKKKKKLKVNGDGREGTASAAGTPRPS
jgi:transcription initiation factor TFIIH subunit 3